jgi:hypothetical protein
MCTQVSGFDKQLLNSLYDDAIQKRNQAQAARSSSTGVPSGATNPFDDIFAASNNYPPAFPVSMAMMNQQLMPRQHRLSRMSGSSRNPFESLGSSQPSTSPPPQQALPPQQPNNPFGNPNLL